MNDDCLLTGNLFGEYGKKIVSDAWGFRSDMLHL